MPARSLAIALAVAWLAAGIDTAAARQRTTVRPAPSPTASQPVAEKSPAVAKPADAHVPVALTCRQYVPAARTTIAVPCPEPAPGAEPPRRSHEAPAAPQPTATPRTTRTVDAPANAARPTQVDAKRCRRFLPSIGETIAVACEDAGEAEKAPAAADQDGREAPARQPSKGTGAPIPRRPYVLADSTSAVASSDASSASKSGACDAAIARASLGTVASGNLAELRRGC